MANVVTLKINDKDVSGRDDETILEIARQNGIPIPTMCQLKGLSNVGACRMCLVAPTSGGRYMPSCATTVQEGMDLQTETPALLENRKMIIEMMFVEGNHICAVSDRVRPIRLSAPCATSAKSIWRILKGAARRVFARLPQKKGVTNG